jgi:hypothetical protein
MKNQKIKKYDNFLSEGSKGVSWDKFRDKFLFGKTIKEIWDDIYSEINPVLKWRKMEEYHQRLKDDVEKGEKELEEKKKIVQDLENKIKERKNGKD